MTGIDWEAVCGAPCVGVFGNATASWTSVFGPTGTLLGVFDNQFRSTTIADSAAPNITDSLPVYGVNRSQFATAGVDPDQGDLLYFDPTEPGPQAGKYYLVVEARPDSHGMFHLALNETSAPP